jgi:hypothetical protein
MQRKQLNLQKMFETAIAIFERYPAAVAFITALQNAVNSFRTLVNQIHSVETLQGSDLRGLTTDKNNFKLKTAQKVAAIAGALRAWSSSNESQELITLAGYKAYALKRLPDDVFVEKCNLIADKAEENIASLFVYSVDMNTIMELRNFINQFRIIYDKTLTMRAQRISSTTQLAILYRKAGKLLREEIDNIVPLTEEQYPEFASVYKKGRVIRDLHGRSIVEKVVGEHNAVLTGFIYDAITGMPIEGVSVEIPLLNLVTETDIDGEFDFESLPAGSCVVRVSGEGYETTEFPAIQLSADDEVVNEFNVQPTATDTADEDETAK